MGVCRERETERRKNKSYVLNDDLLGCVGDVEADDREQRHSFVGEERNKQSVV